MSARKIDLTHHPRRKSGSGLYRTLFVVEVLSNTPVANYDLRDIAYEISEGDCSGRVAVLDDREVDKKDMTKLLQSQGSDPSFLIYEEGD